MTPARMVEAVIAAAKPWKFDAVSIGYPGLVGARGPRSEPLNLGSGWVGFDFAAAFGKPVKMMNAAAMQALGRYDCGRMLFLGLGTGVGSRLGHNLTAFRGGFRLWHLEDIPTHSPTGEIWTKRRSRWTGASSDPRLL
jgi:predicted NBD/HSP70 family sugar kinase